MESRMESRLDPMTTSQLDALTKKQAVEHDGINWVTASFMVLFHIGALAAIFFFTWKALFVAIFLWWLTTSLGIGMGYHRLLTHRIHHRYSDHEGDPHSPVDGKWWAHMGWILFGKSMHHDTTTLAQYVPDLAKDKFHVWITKYNYVPIIALAIILYAIGGLPFVFWGIFVRTVVGLHATWLVNSATHSWGKRRFQTRDRSTNSWWVALLTWGEGWHNNHHAHPVSARHGLKWYEIDFNWYGIWIMKKLRLARQVHCAKLLTPQHEDEILPAEAQPNLIPPKAAENFG